MKDLSFIFLKNLMGAKMGKGFRNFCNNDSSTSTLSQHNNNLYDQQSSSCMENGCNTPNVPPRKSITLEEMILQLDLEEEKARKQKTASYGKFKDEDEEEEEDIKSRFHHRMSSVNNSDILRSARNALNQYPRFSLDGGRDAMYRSSFQINGLKLGRILHLPKSIGGESVIWCKPGLIPKLMGLEAMPVPIRTFHYNHSSKRRDKEDICTAIKNQNIRRQAQRLKQHAMDSSVCRGYNKRSGKGGGSSSCTLTGYHIMNPIAVEPILGLGGTMSWPTPYDYS